MALEAAGLGSAEERAYRMLVRLGDASAAQLAEVLDIGEVELNQVLADLQALGLITSIGSEPARYAPTPPDVGFAPLLLGGLEALDRAREAVAQLTDEHRTTMRRRDASQLVEVITGANAIRQQLRNLQLGTRAEILWFCRAGHVAMTSTDNEEEFSMLERGISYRVIYEQALLEEPGMIDNLVLGVRAGEVARAAPVLPVRMATSDRAIALCPLVSGQDGITEPTAALVRDSSLLTALLALFDSYWKTSSPLRIVDDQDAAGIKVVRPAHPIAGEERELVSLLVAGVSDKAIASRLGVSIRTVQRRVSDLMEQTGAHSRMQLAWQVARRGWLDDPRGQDPAPMP